MRDVLRKYNSIPTPAKAAIWFTICNFLQRGISMITTPVFTRMMSTGAYGGFSTFVTWESVGVVVVTFSIAHAVTYLNVRHDNMQRSLSSLMSLTIIMGLVWMVASIPFLVYFERISKLSGASAICLLLYIVFTTICDSWKEQKNYEYEYRKVIIYTLVSTIVMSLLGIVGVIFFKENQLEARIYSTTAVVTTCGIVFFVATQRKSPCFYDCETWKFSLSFCGALVPHYLSEIILNSSDKLMINSMCGTTDVAIYSVAYSVGMLIIFFCNAINTALVPYQVRKLKNQDYDSIRSITNFVLIIVAIILFCIMLFSREIIYIFGGKKYEDATYAVVPIAIGAYFNYVFQLFARIQEYYNSKRTIVIASVLCAISNIVLNYVFIGIYGYIAASYTTLVCYLLFCVLHYWFYRKVCKLKLNNQMIYDGKSLIVISIIVFLLGIASVLLIEMFYVRLVLVILTFALVLIKRNKIMDEILKLKN